MSFRDQVDRYLKDPLRFPPEFMWWLRKLIEDDTTAAAAAGGAALITTNGSLVIDPTTTLQINTDLTLTDAGGGTAVVSHTPPALTYAAAKFTYTNPSGFIPADGKIAVTTLGSNGITVSASDGLITILTTGLYQFNMFGDVINDLGALTANFTFGAEATRAWGTNVVAYFVQENLVNGGERFCAISLLLQLETTKQLQLFLANLSNEPIRVAYGHFSLYKVG